MRVLVAYASKRGSTAEIAEAIADTLRREGLEADCIGADHVDSLDGYDAVILGCAVYMMHWRGEARHLLRKQRKALAALPFWVFSSGPVGDPEKDDPKWTEPPKVVETVEELGVREHVVFGGRDWDEIRYWAVSIARELTGDRDEVLRPH